MKEQKRVKGKNGQKTNVKGTEQKEGIKLKKKGNGKERIVER